MQKLSYAVLDKLIEKHVTSAEIDVLLYISRYQNNQGVAEGIYYKTVCEELNIVYQTFYDVKESLVEKGIIAVEKNHYLDYDIKILDNDFSHPEDWKQGYLNTNYEMFASSQFRNLKAGAKLLAMDLMKNNLAGGRSYHCKTDNFFKIFMNKFQICKRTLQEYLKMLRLLFYIGVKEHQYWITIRNFAKEKQLGSENSNYHKNSIEVAIRRNRITHTRKEDVIKMERILNNYKRQINELFNGFSLSNTVLRSLEKLNPGVKKEKWKRELKPNLIHRVLRQELGLDVRKLPFDAETI